MDLDFVGEILKHRSLAIVGMEKNTGKTECLNYILHQLKGKGGDIAITSIGIDGEKRDQVCQTVKPEIEVEEGMIFITSEKHFHEKRLVAEVLDVSGERTALGRLVTARARSAGKVLLSGASDSAGLKRLIEGMKRMGVTTTIVDGALSRLSLASPAVTDAMVLATGAALSANIPQLVQKTKYIYDLIGLELAEEKLANELLPVEKGVWAIDGDGLVHDLNIPSVFMLENSDGNIFRYGSRLYVSGAVSDKLLRFLRMQKDPVELIVRDFTRIFAAADAYYGFVKKGGVIKVLQKSRLLAITINPQSPEGFCLDSDKLKMAMEAELGVSVYDVRKLREKITKI